LRLLASSARETAVPQGVAGLSLAIEAQQAISKLGGGKPSLTGFNKRTTGT